jgi:hypothetical protein
MWRESRFAELAIVAFVGLFAGVYSADSLGGSTLLPAMVTSAILGIARLVPVLVFVAAVFLVGQRVWWSGFVMFAGWLPVEDLVRKFSGNDLRLYFVKYVLFTIAVVLATPEIRRFVAPAFGRLSRSTLVLLTCAFAFAIPSVVIGGWTIPVIGIAVRFFFIALVPVGYYLATDVRRFQVVLQCIGVIAAAVCGVGIAQAVIGPEFLNPSSSIVSLPHLVVLRSGGQVVQPSGPFVDVARFASMTTITVLIGVTLLRLASTRRQRFGAALLMSIGLVASFASAGRASLVFSVVIALFGIFYVPGRSASGRLAAFGAALLVIAVVVGASGGVAGQLAADRTEFFSTTLNPFGQRSEIVPRSKYYGRNLVAGVRNGHYLGLGTGNQSIGTQYFDAQNRVGTLSESGWGQVAVEWGVLGLAIWVYWVVRWLGRAMAAARYASPLAPLGRAAPTMTLWMVLILGVYFGFGGNFFDNYVTNIFFWLFSGAVFAAERVRAT